MFPDPSQILFNRINKIPKRAWPTLKRRKTTQMNLEASWAYRVLLQSPSKLSNRSFKLSSRKIIMRKPHPRKTKTTKMMSSQVSQTTSSTSKKSNRVKLGISSFGQVKGEMMLEEDNLNKIICNTPKTIKTPGTKCSSLKILSMTKPNNQTPSPTQSTWKMLRGSSKRLLCRRLPILANSIARTLIILSWRELNKTRTFHKWSWNSQILAPTSISCTSSQRWLKRATSQWCLMILIRSSWARLDTPKLRAPSLLIKLVTSIRPRWRDRFRPLWSGRLEATSCLTNIVKSISSLSKRMLRTRCSWIALNSRFVTSSSMR